MKLKFIFNSEPMAIQSVRFANIGGFSRAYQPQKNKDWKKHISHQACMQFFESLWPEHDNPITVPIAVTKLHYIFRALKSFPKYKIKEIELGKTVYKATKPDLDSNLNKGLFDALTGIVWKDDSQIVALDNVKKYYGLESRIELEIETIEEGKK